MDKELKKLLSKISYNDYLRLKQLSHVNLFSTIMLFNVIRLIELNGNPVLDGVSSSLVVGSILSRILFEYFPLKKYTKEFTELKDLYQQFLKNYNKLNKTMELENPIELVVLFDFMSRSGYLSKDRIILETSGEIESVDNSLLGLNVISGKFVCRHLASMFCDILNDYNILSYPLPVFEGTCSADLSNFDEKYIMKYSDIEIIAKKLKFMQSSKEQITKYIANHMITFAEQDGLSYYLDPALRSIYTTDKDNIGMLNSGERAAATRFLTSYLYLDSTKDLLEFRRKLSTGFHCISSEEKENLIDTTFDKIFDNLDIFDKFYNDNNELYGDICNKMLVIKR